MVILKFGIHVFWACKSLGIVLSGWQQLLVLELLVVHYGILVQIVYVDLILLELGHLLR